MYKKHVYFYYHNLKILVIFSLIPSIFLISSLKDSFNDTIPGNIPTIYTTPYLYKLYDPSSIIPIKSIMNILSFLTIVTTPKGDDLLLIFHMGYELTLWPHYFLYNIHFGLIVSYNSFKLFL